MGIAQELTLREYAGQQKDVSLHVRRDGSKYVTFWTAQHYGYPTLSLAQLKHLVSLLENLTP